MQFVYDDGGRKAAGFKGDAGDCVTRAIAIVTGVPYREVYDALAERVGAFAKGRSRAAKHAAKGGATPRNGVHREVYEPYLATLGWSWTTTMRIGQGCKVHLADGELPGGRLVVSVSRHLVAVIDGVIRDTHDPQRDWLNIVPDVGQELKTGEYRNANGVVRPSGGRCVYGYYTKGVSGG